MLLGSLGPEVGGPCLERGPLARVVHLLADSRRFADQAGSAGEEGPVKWGKARAEGIPDDRVQRGRCAHLPLCSFLRVISVGLTVRFPQGVVRTDVLNPVRHAETSPFQSSVCRSWMLSRSRSKVICSSVGP